jgi:hypothetical protein
MAFFADEIIEIAMVSETAEDKKLSGADLTGQESQAVARILVVGEHTGLRSRLMELVNREVGSGSCLQADSAEQAAKTLQNHRVDFAIVNVPVQHCRGPHLAEKIKLRCPAIPILAVSVTRQKLPRDGAAETESSQQLNPHTAERIVAGIRYMQSLSHSGVSGFTVVVKE